MPQNCGSIITQAIKNVLHMMFIIKPIFSLLNAFNIVEVICEMPSGKSKKLPMLKSLPDN